MKLPYHKYQFTFKSYAKINLYLKIIGKNPNGYHLLDSLISKIDLFDNIYIDKHNFISNSNYREDNIKFVGEFSNNLQKLSKKDNIIYNIISFFKKKFNINDYFDIIIEKNIPVSAGLGGGSANAATIINFFNNSYNLNLSIKELINISVLFGSDIAFFLNQKLSFIYNIGDVIDSFNVNQDSDKSIYAIIINPRQELSTKLIYNNFIFKGYYNNNYLYINNDFKKQFIYNVNFSLLKYFLVNPVNCKDNDLFVTANKFMPILQEIKDFINHDLDFYKLDILYHNLSGSGPSYFILTDNYYHLDLLFNLLSKRFNGFFIKKTKLIFN